MEETRLAPISKAEWPGSTSRWHIQSHKRDFVGPDGPSHWPRRPADIGGFCQSITDQSSLGRKHMYDPPSSIIPATDREQQWRSSSRRLEPFRVTHERQTGTKHIRPKIPEEGLGWTGKLNNYTGPRHFTAQSTVIQPTANQTTKSYHLADVIGTKKWVFSADMGLAEHYGSSERRCERPAQEWSLDKQMQRKIRVPDLEDKRNGIGQANPGDKGYGTAEHAPEYAEMLLNENRGRGNLQRKVMSKIDKTWSQSGSDALMDKHGRRMSDYIQIYCKTPYRKNSMYVHRDAGVQEIADMASEGGSKKMQIWFKGRPCPANSHLIELGIRAKSTVELVTFDEAPLKKETFKEKAIKMAKVDEEAAVSGLNELKLEEKFPASEREEYKEEGEEDEEED